MITSVLGRWLGLARQIQLAPWDWQGFGECDWLGRRIWCEPPASDLVECCPVTATATTTTTITVLCCRGIVFLLVIFLTPTLRLPTRPVWKIVPFILFLLEQSFRDPRWLCFFRAFVAQSQRLHCDWSLHHYTAAFAGQRPLRDDLYLP